MARHSAAVYRRRRLVVLLGLVIVIGLVAAGIWAAVARPWETPSSATSQPPTSQAPQNQAPTSDASSSPSSPPQPTASETPGIAPCAASDIEVTALTDAETYDEGKVPNLSISLTNTGTTDCTINVGTSTQQFVITSGVDTWWRSTDCQKDPSDLLVTLEAGKTVQSSQPVPWDRTRSSVNTCSDENRQRAPAGGASYHIAVSIGGFDSKATRQIILE